jgi:hypothetical protein
MFAGVRVGAVRLRKWEGESSITILARERGELFCGGGGDVYPPGIEEEVVGAPWTSAVAAVAGMGSNVCASLATAATIGDNCSVVLQAKQAQGKQSAQVDAR